MTLVIPDGRQSEAALAIARGTTRLLVSLGFAVVSELGLPSGRRADLVALNARGEVWIIEIKSSLADFRTDQKWQDYHNHCDRLFFAVAPDFPHDILPDKAGLIVADAHSAERLRDADHAPMPSATRKTMLIAFGLASAFRLTSLHDPMIRQPEMR